jgi:hypothetical protein
LTKIINGLNDENIRKTYYAENCKFLRNCTEIHNNSNDVDLKQDLQDEYLAMLLQNEEFLNYIKSDEDFMSTLNDDTKVVMDYKPHRDVEYGYGDGKLKIVGSGWFKYVFFFISDKFDALINNNVNLMNSKYFMGSLNNDEFKIKLFKMGRGISFD